jgi:hypothetical protein
MLKLFSFFQQMLAQIHCLVTLTSSIFGLCVLDSQLSTLNIYLQLASESHFVQAQTKTSSPFPPYKILLYYAYRIMYKT